MARGPLIGNEVEFKKEAPVRAKVLDKSGREKVDGKPMEPPIGYTRTPSLAEQIKQMVRGERLAQEAAAMGAETFEEADDFNIDEEFDPESPYEADFDPPPMTWEEQGTVLGEYLQQGMDRYRKKVEEAERKKREKEEGKEEGEKKE